VKVVFVGKTNLMVDNKKIKKKVLELCKSCARNIILYYNLSFAFGTVMQNFSTN
jgi:hypothetical protein